jgi:pyrroline-5-carboxylate reductase
MVSSGSAPFTQLSGHLVLVGAGKMGTALLEGWLDHGLPPGQTVVIEPSPSPEIEALARRGLLLNPAAAVEAAALVMAVKPQVAPDVLPRLSPWVGAETLVVSIMAGRTLSFVQRMLPATGPAVRAMPNTPAAIKRGVTVLVGNDRVSARQRDLSELLFAGVGTVDWVDDEAMMDAVTAVSGSGPAYVFLLAEALARAGIAAGLPEDLAGRIARATVSGSGELLAQSPLAAATLRQNVTSPGGTTAAALAVLMGASGLEPLMEQAVLQATRRSRELAD